MIEVSSKFVRCLARISQPRGDLNPGRGPILNGTRRKTPHCTPTNAKPAGITIINSLTAECALPPPVIHVRRRDEEYFSKEPFTGEKRPGNIRTIVSEDQRIIFGEYSLGILQKLSRNRSRWNVTLHILWKKEYSRASFRIIARDMPQKQNNISNSI